MIEERVEHGNLRATKWSRRLSRDDRGLVESASENEEPTHDVSGTRHASSSMSPLAPAHEEVSHVVDGRHLHRKRHARERRRRPDEEVRLAALHESARAALVAVRVIMLGLVEPAEVLDEGAEAGEA